MHAQGHPIRLLMLTIVVLAATFVPMSTAAAELQWSWDDGVEFFSEPWFAPRAEATVGLWRPEKGAWPEVGEIYYARVWVEIGAEPESINLRMFPPTGASLAVSANDPVMCWFAPAWDAAPVEVTGNPAWSCPTSPVRGGDGGYALGARTIPAGGIFDVWFPLLPSQAVDPLDAGADLKVTVSFTNAVVPEFTTAKSLGAFPALDRWYEDVPRAGPPDLSWQTGTVSKQERFNGILGATVVAGWHTVEYWGGSGHPVTGEIYYSAIRFTVGDTFDGTARAVFGLELPPATQLAVTPQTPITCWEVGSRFHIPTETDGQFVLRDFASDDEACPQAPVVRSHGYGFGPFTVSDELHVRIPLLTTAPIQAAPLVATMTSDAGEPVTVEATSFVTVEVGDGSITYPGVTRQAGTDRYATAAAISKRTFPDGAPVAYVAVGTAFPDALAGGAVAGRVGGPVLLTTSDALPQATRDELARLQPEEIVVLGGTSAVAEPVVAALKQLTAGEVVRRAGRDRFETAAALSAAAFPDGADVAYVAVGSNFPDALAGGPIAGLAGGPILLTRTDEIPSATAAELTRLAPDRIVVLGGSSVVSDAVLGRLGDQVDGNVVRLAGSDRFGTAAAASAASFTTGVPVVYVAIGSNFPDALAGGPAGVVTGGPILLVTSNDVPASTAAELDRLDPARIVVLGGTGVVRPEVEGLLAPYVR